MNNFRVRDDVISTLEARISHHNKIQEKTQKEIELQKAKEESERAKSLVETNKIPAPKKSKWEKPEFKVPDRPQLKKKTVSDEN